MNYQPVDVQVSADQPQWKDPLQLDLPLQTRLLELEETVRAKLKGRVRNLRLSWRDTGIVLRGLSQTFYGKQLAQHALMEACDLPIQANDIEVV